MAFTTSYSETPNNSAICLLVGSLPSLVVNSSFNFNVLYAISLILLDILREELSLKYLFISPTISLVLRS